MPDRKESMWAGITVADTSSGRAPAKGISFDREYQQRPYTPSAEEQMAIAAWVEYRYQVDRSDQYVPVGEYGLASRRARELKEQLLDPVEASVSREVWVLARRAVQQMPFQEVLDLAEKMKVGSI